MIDIKSPVKSVTDREKWAARGATFMAKVKATKAVWFPPEPAEAGKQTVSKAKNATAKATRKTTGSARKTAGSARKSAAKKTAAKKTAAKKTSAAKS
ncbi:hypothetical protein [Nocardioides guangzhouensis]|uniref:hypothetical protein n=1 Tax=Nocardioides guangzhouensis TaxID=2497878 RepID=UPI00158B0A98|nr:hypothetical protein [Nocardioides guangzhouensis]